MFSHQNSLFLRVLCELVLVLVCLEVSVFHSQLFYLSGNYLASFILLASGMCKMK